MAHQSNTNSYNSNTSSYYTNKDQKPSDKCERPSKRSNAVIHSDNLGMNGSDQREVLFSDEMIFGDPKITVSLTCNSNTYEHIQPVYSSKRSPYKSTTSSNSMSSACTSTRKRKSLSNRRNHTCNVCQRTFKAPSQLARHCLTHNAEKAYQCTICNRRISRKDHLKTHLQTQHKITSKQELDRLQVTGRRPISSMSSSSSMHTVDTATSSDGAGSTVGCVAATNELEDLYVDFTTLPQSSQKTHDEKDDQTLSMERQLLQQLKNYYIQRYITVPDIFDSNH